MSGIVFGVVVGAVFSYVLGQWANLRGDFDSSRWRRCLSCSGKLVRVEAELDKHIGHRLGPAIYFETLEYLRVILRLK